MQIPSPLKFIMKKKLILALGRPRQVCDGLELQWEPCAEESEEYLQSFN